MLKIRCKDCNKELDGHPTQARSCGCPNMATILGDKITAADLSNVILLNNNVDHKSSNNVLSSSDLMWQQERKNRGVRKLTFEIR
jgi:hypothetical protein